MTNKYETGSYLVLLFDKHGTQVGKEKKGNYSEAVACGNDKCKAPPYASFVVTRTVYNSIDNSDPWRCRGEENENEDMV